MRRQLGEDVQDIVFVLVHLSERPRHLLRKLESTCRPIMLSHDLGVPIVNEDTS